jgi:small redox-active disulfide protein 2
LLGRRIEVYGSEPPCPKCRKVEEVVRKAVAKSPGQVSVEKGSVLSPEALALEILMTPAVVVDGRVVCQGRIPKESEIEQILRSEQGE